jgi:pSer/pThr/pTyr-binding forkhead associated (FHA) protein
MGMTLAITVLTGPHKNRRYCFVGHLQCTVGRGEDCLVRLCGNEQDRAISRHHCELDIDLPTVRIRDLGSLNGTYLNGKKIDAAEKNRDIATTVPCENDCLAVTLNDGDVITLAGTSFRVDLVDCPLAPALDMCIDLQAKCPV